MPIPKPEPQENMAGFLSRCMADDTMLAEYPNERQRIAICARQWKEKE